MSDPNSNHGQAAAERAAPRRRANIDLSRALVAAFAALPAAWLLACGGPAMRGASGAPASAREGAATALPALQREDVLWLERATFGLDGATIADYRALGRERFLERQLRPRSAPLPAAAAAAIDAMNAARPDVVHILLGIETERKAINALPNGHDKEQARKSLQQRGNEFAYQASRALLLRALYSPDQLKEQMVWFWLNHFSVFQQKAELRWLLADYTDQAIRPHALGRFRDLVLATLEHPAMLQYLDNARNAVGHVNENYARELLELHTLGAGSGYTQEDVQQLALVLTGVGINAGAPPRLRPEWQQWYRRAGAFEFNPVRHDFSQKVLLGRALQGRGFTEVEEAVTLIVKQPACAHFVSRKLAAYFVADDPPPQLVERMAQTFKSTDGDIAQVLRTMFLARGLDAALGEKFKDPMRFVSSAVRFAYDGRPISNTHPVLNWLRGLGEAPFGRQTPDGYPLNETNWASSGQMSRRFEIARAVGTGNAGLFSPEDGGAPGAAAFPRLSNRLYFEAVEPFLAARTRQALDQAATPQEWNTFLLSSPEFNYE